MIVTFPDGSVREFAEDATFMDVARSISEGFARKALAAQVDGALYDLSRKIPGDVAIRFVTFDDEAGRAVFWHSTAHIMAAAVKQLFPGVRVAIGPAVDDGFYYDFDFDRRFSEEDLEKIEIQMKKIADEGLVFERAEITREEAIALFSHENERYKTEIASGLTEGPVTLYTVGGFTDLCRGPHIPNSGMVKAVKLLSVAGAYWRGDEKNPMLQRIYGVSFPDNKRLAAHLEYLEEVKRRDHRTLGAKLDLFSVDEEIGAGLVLWHPNGAILRGVIEDFWRDEHRKRGYQVVYTPHIASERVYKRSGHLETYNENMYSPMDIDGSPYYVKPMNCPGHIKIYQTRTRSYRELPLRLCELGTVYRYERSGVLHGMLRVRGFTQDDSHIFCTTEQVVGEVKKVLDFIVELMHVFGYDYSAYLSTRPGKSIGEERVWEDATASLKQALEENGTPYELDEGGGAFYGPKIDIKLRDALGRMWQGPTIQVDFNLPERFDVNYVGSDGQEHRVVMIHRVVLGSMERFIGGLIEHFAGAFPVWLAPVQVVVMPITDAQHEYAAGLVGRMRALGLRVEFDSRNEKVNRKIRDAEEMKIPYMLVIGQKEVDAGTVSVRKRGQGDLGALPADEIIARIRRENVEKTRD